MVDYPYYFILKVKSVFSPPILWYLMKHLASLQRPGLALDQEIETWQRTVSCGRQKWGAAVTAWLADEAVILDRMGECTMIVKGIEVMQS